MNLDSVHLCTFPDVSKIKFNKDLVNIMDLVKEICSVALYLRDKENLRVRLPLKQIKIIGNNLKQLENYKEIIADEVNVKSVIFEENVDSVADFIMEVDLKKLGVRLGEKLKIIMKALKDNKWKILENGKADVDGIILEKDEYVMKLKPKNKDVKNLQSLSDNKTLVELDFTITQELEFEGLARDIVRLIQQDRKQANLNLSDRIKLSIKANSPVIIQAINDNSDYIKSQTLALDLKIVKELNEEFSFGEEFNKEFINIGFTVQNNVKK